jgi:hypothetical protein
VSPDEWQAHLTREAAKVVGKWPEAQGRLARGRLGHPVASLRLSDLEAVASVAISRFIVLASQRIREAPEQQTELEALLMG